MKNLTNKLAVVAMGAMITTSAMAAESVDSTIKAPTSGLRLIFPNMKGSIATSYRINTKYSASTRVSQTPRWRLAPKLSTTFFDKKLSVSASAFFDRASASASANRTSYFTASLNMFKNDIVDIKLNSSAVKKVGKVLSNITVGPNVSHSTKIETDFGEVTLGASIGTSAVFNATADVKDYKVTNTVTGYSLAQTDAKKETKTKKRHPDISDSYGLSVGYTPSMIQDKALTLSASVGVSSEYIADYIAAQGDKGEIYNYNGYKLDSRGTSTTASVSYKVNKSISLSNSTTYSNGGIYQSRADARWSNTTGISASIF